MSSNLDVLLCKVLKLIVPVYLQTLKYFSDLQSISLIRFSRSKSHRSSSEALRSGGSMKNCQLSRLSSVYHVDMEENLPNYPSFFLISFFVYVWRLLV